MKYAGAHTDAWRLSERLTVWIMSLKCNELLMPLLPRTLGIVALFTQLDKFENTITSITHDREEFFPYLFPEGDNDGVGRVDFHCLL